MYVKGRTRERKESNDFSERRRKGERGRERERGKNRERKWGEEWRRTRTGS